MEVDLDSGLVSCVFGYMGTTYVDSRSREMDKNYGCR